MKSIPPDQVESNRVGGPRGSMNGRCFIKRRSAVLQVIFSQAFGWDHVSVSLPTRCPTWNEMCYVKRMFFDSHEVVMQLHPAELEYVNDHPYCLHLWRPQNDDDMRRLKKSWGSKWDDSWVSHGDIPLPETRLVGIKT